VPRTTSANRSSVRGRRRGGRGSADTRSIVDQIAQLVDANEALQRENQELTQQNEKLRSELQEIGSALGKLTGAGPAPRGRRGRRGVSDLVAGLLEARPRRQRKPITDPEALEKRKQALAKARAVRAERLAAAKAAATEGNGQASASPAEAEAEGEAQPSS
jgi:hypothetical protein